MHVYFPGLFCVHAKIFLKLLRNLTTLGRSSKYGQNNCYFKWLQTSMQGLFGNIQFDTFGARSNFSAFVTEHKHGTIVKVKHVGFKLCCYSVCEYSSVGGG